MIIGAIMVTATPTAAGGPRARHRGRWGLVAAVLALGGVGAGVVVSTAGSAPPPRERFVAVRRTTLREKLVASGTIEPGREALLDFTVGGTVASVDVHPGQVVRSGQVLARLSTTTLSAEVTAAAAAVGADQAVVAADATASSAQRAADAATLASAQTQLAAARQALAAATLAAPFAGTVATVDLAPGRAVSGSATAASSTASGAQLTLVSTSSWVVDAGLVDTQVSRVRAGEPASVLPDGSTAAAAGVVASVGLLPSSPAGAGGVATYPVQVKVAGDPAGLLPGAGAQVSVVVASVPGALVVPSVAVRTGAARSSVMVRQGSSTLRRRVVVGITAGGLTQIRSGLSAGQEVVIPTRVGASGAGRLSRSGRSGPAGHKRHHGRGGGAGGLGGAVGGG